MFCSPIHEHIFCCSPNQILLPEVLLPIAFTTTINPRCFMGDTCGTTECSGTTRLYNTSPWMRRHTKMLLLLRKLYHTPPPQHYKFNPSARQNTHLRPHMYKMLCLARETHLPCNTETHFSHTTPRRGISSPQPMLANAQPPDRRS